MRLPTRLPNLPTVSRRDTKILATAALVGLVVGIVVLGFELLVEELIHAVETQPIGVVAAAPVVGLAVTAAALRYLGGTTSPSTSDEYVRAFHERIPTLPLRIWFARLVGGVATVGSGGAVGLEGPAIYTGATIGASVRRVLGLSADDTRLLLSAGAAAGISAIFKTPATGVIFALEAPYTADVSRRGLLPALVASAVSYSAFVLTLEIIRPDEASFMPPLSITGRRPELGTAEIVGAILLGLLAGIGAWLFASAVAWVKSLADRPLLPRLVIGGAILAALAWASQSVFNEPMSTGPGTSAADWATDRDRAVGFLALLLVMRVVATLATIGAGGAGGLFIPLAVQGILLGSLVAALIGESRPELFPVIGEAAFLGAGYRTPLASVMFVAETTDSSLYVIPALIAAAVSQLVPGRSVSKYQLDDRLGHLERRFALPISSALTTDVLTVPPDATLAELVDGHLIGRREQEVPVVDGERYLGMCGLDHIAGVDRAQWDGLTVADRMDTDAPAAQPSWSLRQAVASMEKTGATMLPVTDAEGIFIGIVNEEQILKLDQILAETGS